MTDKAQRYLITKFKTDGDIRAYHKLILYYYRHVIPRVVYRFSTWPGVLFEDVIQIAAVCLMTFLCDSSSNVLLKKPTRSNIESYLVRKIFYLLKNARKSYYKKGRYHSDYLDNESLLVPDTFLFEEEKILANQILELAMNVGSGLTELEKYIIRNYIMVRLKTQEEISCKFNVSQPYVNKVMKRLIKRIRSNIGEE